MPYFKFLLCILFLGASQVQAQTSGSFSTTWQTDNFGTSADDQITIPTTGVGYNYDVYWEDTASSTINGSITAITENLTITFPSPGIYRVDITGDFPRIFFNNTGDRLKIITVEQWGDIAWTSMANAFHGAANIQITAADAPDLSNVTSLLSMFEAATSFNSNINHWDISNVTSIRKVFSDTLAFNQPLDNWNVSMVTDFRDAFYASAFNQDISNWNTSSGTTFVGMFMLNSAFNQPVNSWDLSSATSLGSMFRLNTAFDQPISDWNVSNVTNFNNMFLSSIFGTDNYSDLLVGWSGLPSLQAGRSFSVGTTKYQNYASSSRQFIIDTYSWIITDGGLFVEYTITYDAGLNATLVGSSTQIIEENQDAESVEVVPNEGFRFVQWSDGVLDNPRTDVQVTGTISVQAVLEEVLEEVIEEAEPVRRTSRSSGRRVVRLVTPDVSAGSEYSLSLSAPALLELRFPELFSDHDFSTPITDPAQRLATISVILELFESVVSAMQLQIQLGK